MAIAESGKGAPVGFMYGLFVLCGEVPEAPAGLFCCGPLCTLWGKNRRLRLGFFVMEAEGSSQGSEMVNLRGKEGKLVCFINSASKVMTEG